MERWSGRRGVGGLRGHVDSPAAADISQLWLPLLDPDEPSGGTARARRWSWLGWGGLVAEAECWDGWIQAAGAWGWRIRSTMGNNDTVQAACLATVMHALLVHGRMLQKIVLRPINSVSTSSPPST